MIFPLVGTSAFLVDPYMVTDGQLVEIQRIEIADAQLMEELRKVLPLDDATVILVALADGESVG